MEFGRELWKDLDAFGHMSELLTCELKRVVESQHGGTARLVQSVPIRATVEGQIVWGGVVSVFALQGYSMAEMAYAWSHSVEGSKRRRFFAVLHIPPIDSPAVAVKAAVAAEGNGFPSAALFRHSSHGD